MIFHGTEHKTFALLDLEAYRFTSLVTSMLHFPLVRICQAATTGVAPILSPAFGGFASSISKQ
jgi:hypothetical protein